jgi:hypothetical protein
MVMVEVPEGPDVAGEKLTVTPEGWPVAVSVVLETIGLEVVPQVIVEVALPP